ncbi:TrkH family potassium uptake protein [Gracilibacillus caseinilyticus]|uniref:TrkH family potassium uptake protein n=1 Tax=Gracilibacillus caseinilyticus TaxID=2932256 RepID=A0ABY4F0M1_9BACI|nr:TrkH family potassium uptake protein [Gracilibacillus caseinilyticus]UOQ50211.1 TrkH family potassium uptake protein [Gracilibacillus caseinilyticus]
MKRKYINLKPSQLLIFIFAICIIIGTILLRLPIATTASITWLDALFTATSAMTVTGLIVVDTPVAFTIFGEIVIALLIQLGGLGIMSFAVLIYIMLGKRIGIKERLIIQQALNQTSIGGIIKLVRNLFIFSLTIEMIAMFFLAIKWVPDLGWGKGLYFSFFHAISAFNNAGFSLWSDSLMGYVGDPITNIVISGLFIIGGIGFTVLSDIWYKKKFQKLSLHSKLMIAGTFIINIVAMFIIFILEYNNLNSLGGLPTLSDKLWASYFQATSPRTAGFNTLDIGSLEEPTLFFMLLLMFIGAGSASTGGGIKLTTFIVIILAVFTFLQGKKEITIAERSISQIYILRSLAIATMGVFFIFSAIFLLSITEQAPFMTILFEVISAFGTVGLSIGLTGSLSMIGKIIIILIMFIGKLGPLTLAFSLASSKEEKIKYPHEGVLTG